VVDIYRGAGIAKDELRKRLILLQIGFKILYIESIESKNNNRYHEKLEDISGKMGTNAMSSESAMLFGIVNRFEISEYWKRREI